MEGVSNFGYVSNVDPSPINNQDHFIKIELERNESRTVLNEPENLNKNEDQELEKGNVTDVLDKDSPDPNENSILSRTILSLRLYVDNLVKNVLNNKNCFLF